MNVLYAKYFVLAFGFGLHIKIKIVVFILQMCKKKKNLNCVQLYNFTTYLLA